MRSSVLCLLLILIFSCLTAARSRPQDDNPPPDARYKADILAIFGHPDDEVEVAAFLAQQIELQHKRVAVVYMTRGNSGGNAAGLEQATALGDIREMEARHSLASYGITNAWFLHGADTPGADVLHSLEAWGHGRALDEIVRLVRITRPGVIITWLPAYVVGENHEDHQGSGVLATEAFDLAANPLAFPEQLETPRNRAAINNYGEGLRPWQPKKIYYVSDADHFDLYKGNGPEYATGQLSPSKKVPYSRIAANAWTFYLTQNDFSDAQLKEFTEAPVRFIFGKSLVGGTPTGDVFEGIISEPIAYAPPRGYEPPAPGLRFDLGGPWAFYREFWPAHDIGHLKELFSPEAQVGPGESLWVPLLIRNNTESPRDITLRVTLPPNWTSKPEPSSLTIPAHESASVQLTVTSSVADKNAWKTLAFEADSKGQKIGAASLRVKVAGNGLPQ